ncbi:hypothetical protein FQA39_LY07519 [Lamprigera yunnana]|nr:hypothetical protein FQA39_LY07519 [Lamprigera yunnana]
MFNLMDSIPTSCIQLAKEQIIKYSDPKYNINDLKTGDCEQCYLIKQFIILEIQFIKEEEWIQFHEQRENINKYFQTFDTMWKPRQIGSKTLTFEMIEEKKILKIEDMSGNEVYLGWESVSEVWSLESVLRYRLSYSSEIQFIKEEEWIQFHEQRENINKYFQTFDTMWKPRQIGSKTLTFEMIEEKKILKIEDMSGNEVYLGWESVSEVWSLESVLRYRLSYSSGSNFKYFYEDTFDTMWKPRQIGSKTLTFEMIEEKKILKIEDMSGNEVYLGWESVSEVWSLESVLRYRLSYSSEIQFIKEDVDAVCQEHWTKSYDLKSAVERLYEELGALEFDADHEAIYGMERYYTVQQCEELRDKYKIGRKVCRKFLQGKTCSQCLVKRISKIGLRHFLDTVNKYIKDCSDSSSLSDEEVFKAVEQNGEETTEEEE